MDGHSVRFPIMNISRIAAIVMAVTASFCGSAAAQSNPNWARGYVPSAATWNNTWSSKQDYTFPAIANVATLQSGDFSALAYTPARATGVVLLGYYAAGDAAGYMPFVAVSTCSGVSVPCFTDRVGTAFALDEAPTNFYVWGAKCIGSSFDDAPAFRAWAVTSFPLSLPGNGANCYINSVGSNPIVTTPTGTNVYAVAQLSNNGQTLLGAGEGATTITLGPNLIGNVAFFEGTSGCKPSVFSASPVATTTGTGSGTTLTVASASGIVVGDIVAVGGAVGGSTGVPAYTWVTRINGTALTTNNTTSLSGTAVSFYTPAQAGCATLTGVHVGNFTVNAAAAPGSWLIYGPNAKQHLTENVFCTQCGGFEAFGNFANSIGITRNVTITANAQPNGCGGNPALVNPVFNSGSQPVEFYEWGTNNSSSNWQPSNIVIGSGNSVATSPVSLSCDVVHFLADTNANTNTLTNFFSNTPGTGIRLADTFTAQPGPNFFYGYNVQVQTPFDPLGAYGGAAFDLQAGSVFKFFGAFANHCFGACAKIGTGVVGWSFFEPQFNGSASALIDNYGVNGELIGGVLAYAGKAATFSGTSTTGGASSSGTTLTITGIASGTIIPGALFTASGGTGSLNSGTYNVGQLTGPSGCSPISATCIPGGAGTYQMSQSAASNLSGATITTSPYCVQFVAASGACPNVGIEAGAGDTKIVGATISGAQGFGVDVVANQNTFPYLSGPVTMTGNLLYGITKNTLAPFNNGLGDWEMEYGGSTLANVPGNSAIIIPQEGAWPLEGSTSFGSGTTATLLAANMIPGAAGSTTSAWLTGSGTANDTLSLDTASNVVGAITAPWIGESWYVHLQNDTAQGSNRSISVQASSGDSHMTVVNGSNALTGGLGLGSDRTMFCQITAISVPAMTCSIY